MHPVPGAAGRRRRAEFLPPAEHITQNAWWNIYQPVNHHNLTSDMGMPAQLQAMINTCHAAGVRIYADVVFNQMAVGSGTGVGG
ncbi:MAG: hypothetical protein QM767_00670 [Anaeromyxobacter sp.]